MIDDELVRELQRLREDVDYLTTLLEPGLTAATLTAGPGAQIDGQPGTIRPVAAHVWQELAASEAAAAWAALTAWVDWLTDRYQLHDTLPGCWYRHGAFVEELDALRAAWDGAHHDPAARLTDAAYWHELLARTLARLHDWNSYGCGPDTHHDNPPPSTDDVGRAARDEYLQADVQWRTAATSPGGRESQPPP